jgi:hypothetical protein
VISDPWIDRSYLYIKDRVLHPRRKSVKPEALCVTDLVTRQLVTDRRNELRAAGKCLNGPLVGNVGKGGVVHGPVFKLDRCKHCYLVKVRCDEAAARRR